MKTVQLVHVTEPIRTWTPSRDPGQEFTYLDLSSVDNQAKRVVNPVRLLGAEAPSRARQLVQAGDVLVSTVRPNLNAVAAIDETLDGATASTGFTVLRPNHNLDSRYLFHWVRSTQFIADMVRKATGASYPAVSDRIVKESSLPLPTLDEQCRIAAILDKANALREISQSRVGLFEALIETAFGESFGGRNWPVEPLGSLTMIVDCPHSTPRWTESGEVCVRTSNLQRGSWDWSDQRYVSPADYVIRSQRGEARPGDIVLSREGTVGVAAIVEDGMRLCMGQRLVQVRTLEPLMPQYTLRFLLKALDPKRIEHVMVGSTARHLNVKDLRALPIPVPPLKLQKEFEGKVERIVSLRKSACQSTSQMNRLFASLQSGAFSGQR